MKLTRRQFIGRGGALLASLTLSPAVLAGAFDDFFLAVKRDLPGPVQTLLRRGFDPNAVEESRGDTGMILALREGSMKVFTLLLNHPATDLEAKARNGDTALMIAAFRNNKPAVQALLDKGAQVNRTGWTALHYAAASGATDIVGLLLEQHAYIDAESPNGSTPLMMAAGGGHIFTVKLLLDEGADLTLKNALGLDAVDFAVHGEHPDVVTGLRYRIRRDAAAHAGK